MAAVWDMSLWLEVCLKRRNAHICDAKKCGVSINLFQKLCCCCFFEGRGKGLFLFAGKKKLNLKRLINAIKEFYPGIL